MKIDKEEEAGYIGNVSLFYHAFAVRDEAEEVANKKRQEKEQEETESTHTYIHIIYTRIARVISLYHRLAG